MIRMLPQEKVGERDFKARTLHNKNGNITNVIAKKIGYGIT